MRTIAPTSRRFGVEIECGTHDGVYGLSERLKRAKIPHQDVGHDGTCAEVRTKPLKGAKGFQDLKRLMDFLRDNGCYITKADGQHIHIEAKDFINKPDLQAKLVESYVANRDHIIKFVDPYRRNYGACSNRWSDANKKVPKEALDNIKNGQIYGRADLNLSNLDPTDSYSHGTVEIRLHEGTLDFEKIEAWIKFWQFFLERVKAAKKPLRPYACEDTLFTGIRIDPAMKAKLKAAAANYGTTSSLPDYT